MRSDTNHREQLDDFSEFMKRKLEDHRLPVDDLCWEEIEERTKSRQPEWLWWTGSSVAAAVIVLLLLFSPFQAGDEPRGGMVAPVASVEDEEKIPHNVDNDIPENAVTPVDKSVKAKKLIAAVIPASSNDTHDNAAPFTEVTKEPEKQEAPVDDTVVDKTATDSPTKAAKREERQDLYNYKKEKYNFSAESKKKREEGEWSVNAGFGTGGHVSFDLFKSYTVDAGPNDGIEPGHPGIVPPPVRPPSFDEPGTLSPDAYEYVDAALPLSFGVTVRKDINRYIGIETGLVYTYLSSNLDEWGDVRYRSKLELHYLGIPVNLVVSLWQNSRWNVYLSGGFMLEKGLRAKQTEDRFWQTEMKHNVGKYSIDGLQWSLNASAGVSYRFYKNWSFYFEPRISYYFDNAQPKSIRTENSVIVGVGAGVRFGF